MPRPKEPRRLRREKRSIAVMIGMYCRAQHGHRDELCADCHDLHDYAMKRIEKCPYCFRKPTCVNCPIHCYRKEQRASIREVMAYAGPRMLRRHPVLAVMHIIDGFRHPEQPKRRR